MDPTVVMFSPLQSVGRIFLQEHGAIDMIIDRRNMRDKIADILAILFPEKGVLAEVDNKFVEDVPVQNPMNGSSQ